MKRKIWGRRLAAFGLCSMLCVPANLQTVYAEEMSEEPSYTGYVEAELKPAESIHQAGEPELLMAADEPYYKTSKLPPVRDQDPYGTCWAFSSIACMEIYLMNHPEVAGELDSIDLSELHLAYFSNNSVVDPLGGTTGDTFRYTDTNKTFLDAGGNYGMAINVLQDWVGAVDETEVPYSSATTVLVSGIDAEKAYGYDSCHLQGYRRINMDDTDDIKQAIMDYGAVGISYYHSNTYYKSQNAAYYCNTATSPNHGVTIVGWDDNFDKAKFSTSPANDGAWIVRNSWGSSWGDGGYFYLSYEDATIGSTGEVFLVEPANNYQHNYQYDGAKYYNDTVNMPASANVFTIQGTKAQWLEAVSFEVYSVNQNYTIEIYKNPADLKYLDAGSAAATLTGITDYEGMYTVKLQEPLYLEPDDVFAVAVTLVGEDGSFGRIIKDYNMSGCASSSGTGQSMAYNGSFWYDYGYYNHVNFHIKAYTNDVLPSEIISVTGVSISEQQVTVHKGNTKTLTATISPANATNKSVMWSSSNPSVATVDSNGRVTAVSAGQATITATTVDGNYQNSCEVTVDVPLQQITLNQTKLNLNKGAGSQLQITYNPTDTTADKTVTWSSSNTSVATVDSTGKVTAVGAGQAVITAKVGNCTAACDVTISIPLQSITLSQTSLNLNKGAGSQLQITYNPTDTTADKTVTWSSSNTSVATVDSTGKVTAVGAGQAVIKAKVGNCTANCSVSVTVPKTDEKSDSKPGSDSGTGSNTENGTEAGTGSNTAAGTETGKGSSTADGTGTVKKNDTAAETPAEMPKWQEGWINDNGVWYYIDSDGQKTTGWLNDEGTWYYMNLDGSMVTGWLNDGGTWYYMNSSGAMDTGWVNDGGTWYYMNGSGAMVTGWVCDGGHWYYMNGSGDMATGWVYSGGKWYYMKSNGAMATGWLYTGGHWYYLYSDGSMAVNTRIGKYRIGANGTWN